MKEVLSVFKFFRKRMGGQWYKCLIDFNGIHFRSWRHHQPHPLTVRVLDVEDYELRR